MKIKNICRNLLWIFLTLLSIDSYSSSNYSFDLPPGEQILIQGNLKGTKKIECKLESKEQNTDNVFSFISIKNKCIVNKLTMPEGTLMTLFISENFGNQFLFELDPESSLGITNDSEEIVNLKCNKLA